ncbi:hypothetical protein AB1Y20_013268 [Prymnesium parvum]|uniref:Uncharacterized protein n=1 Tax=Prymnesium parvum TaxID=97485 RepID=A0AB34IMQ4_PRYPA
MLRHGELHPHHVPWPHACSRTPHVWPSPPPASSRIASLDAAMRCRSHCEPTRRRARAAIDEGAREMLAQLHARRVLCDASRRCTVAAAGWVWEVCVPRAAARLCEPYGEVWQQVGAPLANFTPDGCVRFDLRLLAAWWRRLRTASPFFSAGQQPSDERFSTYKPLRPQEFRSPSVRLWPRPPPLSAEEKARKAAAQARHIAEFDALLDELRASPRTLAPLSYERCAFVGSGGDLNCGAAKGRRIDAADAVFRANSFQHRPPPAGEGASRLGERLRMQMVEPAQAGRRTDYRVNCLFGNESRSALRHREACIVSFNWWSLTWGLESFNNARTMCCEGKYGPLRSSYTLSALREHARQGLQIAFFRGFKSGIDVLDKMRKGSGGNALLSAISMCRQPVDVYGAGLLSVDGVAGDKVYAHAYDPGASRCIEEEQGARFIGPKRDIRLLRWHEKTEWKRQRIKTELLLHVLHALDVIHWVL